MLKYLDVSFPECRTPMHHAGGCAALLLFATWRGVMHDLSLGDVCQGGTQWTRPHGEGKNVETGWVLKLMTFNMLDKNSQHFWCWGWCLCTRAFNTLGKNHIFSYHTRTGEGMISKCVGWPSNVTLQDSRIGPFGIYLHILGHSHPCL